MSFLNANLPGFKAWVRSEYLHNLEDHHGEFEQAIVFACNSIPGRAMGFTLLTDRGAQWTRLPISALCHKKDASTLPCDHLQLWNCLSYDIAVTEYQVLGRCRVLLKDRKWYPGEYRFTIDFTACDKSRIETNWSEVPEEHKSAHFIALDNGCFCLQPNNRIRWEDPDFIVKELGAKPTYKAFHHIFTCESGEKWVTEDSGAYMYETEAKP